MRKNASNPGPGNAVSISSSAASIGCIETSLSDGVEEKRPLRPGVFLRRIGVGSWMRSFLRTYVPIVQWFPRYKWKRDARADVIAGLTVASMLVPQSLAYAQLAEVPLILGLYSSLFGVLTYALFGSSRHLAVGPVAVVSILSASGAQTLIDSSSSLTDRETIAACIAMFAGLFQLILGALRLGFLANLLSHSVVSGFTSGASVVIMCSQLKHLFGLKLPNDERLHMALYYLFKNIAQTNVATLLLGSGSIAVLFLCRRIKALRTSGPIIVVVIGAILSVTVDLESRYNVKVVGTVPAGLPSPSFPVGTVAFEDLGAVLRISGIIAFIGFAESFSIGKKISLAKSYQISSDQELRALGLADIAVSFFHGLAVAGGFSRTAVTVQAGARTLLSSLVTALGVTCSLLFLTSFFQHLPTATLAAIVIVAVLFLIDVEELKHAYRLKNKTDFALAALSLVLCVFVGVEIGIIAPVCLSALLSLYRSSFPAVSFSRCRVCLPVSSTALQEKPEAAAEGCDGARANEPGSRRRAAVPALAMTVKASPDFMNILSLVDRLDAALAAEPGLDAGRPVECIVLDARDWHFVDASALHSLQSLTLSLRSKGMVLAVLGAGNAVTRALREFGLWNPVAGAASGLILISADDSDTVLMDDDNDNDKRKDGGGDGVDDSASEDGGIDVGGGRGAGHNDEDVGADGGFPSSPISIRAGSEEDVSSSDGEVDLEDDLEQTAAGTEHRGARE